MCEESESKECEIDGCNNSKGQITIDYVLSVGIVIVVISTIILFVSSYKENITREYLNATMKAITSDMAYTITATYIRGHESGLTPGQNETLPVAKSSMILPADIGRMKYDIWVNETERTACGLVGAITYCQNIIGVPSNFNLTDSLDGDREIIVTYWKERNGYTDKEYIIVE